MMNCCEYIMRVPVYGRRQDPAYSLGENLGELIRCKDCEYWTANKSGDVTYSYGTCRSRGIWSSLLGDIFDVEEFQTEENFYCGHAGRKDK